MGSALAVRAGAQPRLTGANDAVRVGIIGLGARGTELFADLRARSDVRILAVCDSDESRVVSGTAFSKAHRDWRELVERPDLDAVVIAAPDSCHASMTLAAFDAGKDVYCERPLALTVEEARAVRDAAQASGRILQVGVQEASEGQWHTARERVLAPGLLGRVLWCQGRYGRHDRDGVTGALYAQLAPLLLALDCGAPQRVSAAGGWGSAGQPDALVATLEYAEGHTIVLASTVATRRRDLPAVIRGTEATLYAEGGRLRRVIEDDGCNALDAAGTDAEFLDVEQRPDHVSDWLACIRSRRQPVCGPELAYATTAAIAAALRALREGCSVAVS